MLKTCKRGKACLVIDPSKASTTRTVSNHTSGPQTFHSHDIPIRQRHPTTVVSRFGRDRCRSHDDGQGLHRCSLYLFIRIVHRGLLGRLANTTTKFSDWKNCGSMHVRFAITQGDHMHTCRLQHIIPRPGTGVQSGVANLAVSSSSSSQYPTTTAYRSPRHTPSTDDTAMPHRFSSGFASAA